MRHNLSPTYLKKNYLGLNNFYNPHLSPKGFPLIKSQSYIVPEKLYKYSSRRQAIYPDLFNSCCHFFVDDNRFKGIWSNPFPTNFLKQFAYLILPDFTIASEFSPIQNQWQHYRKMWIGAYWESHGLKVIPCANWAEPDSYDWCFEGMPTGTTIGIATMEINQPDEWQIFNDGLKAMIQRLEPSNLLIYGKLSNYYGQIEIPYNVPYTRYFYNYLNSLSYPFPIKK